MMTLKKSALTLTVVAFASLPFLAQPDASASPPAVVGPAPAPTMVKSPLKPGVLSCGVGACLAYPAKKVPGIEGHSGCDPNPGLNGWQSAPDTINHSWDTNCDGKVDKEVLPDAMYTVTCVWKDNACTPSRVAPVGQTPVCGSVWTPVTCPTVSGPTACHGTPLGGKITQRCM